VQHVYGFFHQLKVRQQIGRKYSIQAACRRMRLEVFLYSGQDQNNKKIKKAIPADVLSEAYPLIPLSCRYNPAGQYL
jgi:hypothetical protein